MNKSKEEPISTSFNSKASCYQYVYLRGKSSKKEKGTTKGAVLCSLRKNTILFIPRKPCTGTALDKTKPVCQASQWGFRNNPHMDTGDVIAADCINR